MGLQTTSTCERARMIEEEILIDLDEWAELHGHPEPFPVPSGITAPLWRRIERLPFRLAGRISLEERVLDVTERARLCLSQRGVDLRDHRGHAGVTLGFSASLPSTARDSGRQPLLLHCGPCGSAEMAVTIALPPETERLPVSGFSALGGSVEALDPNPTAAPRSELDALCATPAAGDPPLTHWEVFGAGLASLPWIRPRG